ncbi:MAG: SDR family NAD(P)-dependent oxidoreductase [Candidatus Nanohaloarchaeota archaeon QJJ-7]|nr:SDR family NAD(P)-dependent oxidoreductase [Candidatus Nanohaloarchaeota archaeon QJJ-7]
MKALVTGGAGFIGSNLAVKLAESGHDVVVLDDMYLGTRENLEGYEDKIQIIEGDVRDRETVREACEGVDVVFHDAARSSAPMHKDEPVEGTDVNVLGFINVMEEARENDFNVVYASTSSMYGSVEPPHKEDSGEEPVNLYSASKMSRELYATVYHRAYDIDVIGLRYFSVYGPREKAKGQYANLISQFMWKMMDGERPEIWGDGSRTRDFTYVGDIVRGNIKAAESDVSGEVVNLGTGDETRLDELVDMLNEELETDIDPVHTEHPKKNKVMRTKADNSKAKELIGWEPQINIEEGIKKTAEWYR